MINLIKFLLSKVRTKYLRPEISVLEFILILVMSYYITRWLYA